VTPPSCDSRPRAEALHARLGEQHFRGLKARSRRWLAVASVPVWLQAGWGVLPDLVSFWAVLIQGGCLVLTVAFAALEHRWRQRAAEQVAGPPPAVLHVLLSSWDDVRAALWSGLALVSLVPGVYVAVHRPFPRPVLSAAIAAAVAVFVLLVVAETLPRLGRTEPTR
jgi:hypothetical protein